MIRGLKSLHMSPHAITADARVARSDEPSVGIAADDQHPETRWVRGSIDGLSVSTAI